jgi:hypothetical protein
MACLSATWDGPAGPETHRLLEGVSFIYTVPSNAEAPYEILEMWLYARLDTAEKTEDSHPFRVRLVWHDSPNGRREVWTRVVTPPRLANLVVNVSN